MTETHRRCVTTEVSAVSCRCRRNASSTPETATAPQAKLSPGQIIDVRITGRSGVPAGTHLLVDVAGDYTK